MDVPWQTAKVWTFICDELVENKHLNKIKFLAAICEQRWKLSYARVISYIMN